MARKAKAYDKIRQHLAMAPKLRKPEIRIRSEVITPKGGKMTIEAPAAEMHRGPLARGLSDLRHCIANAHVVDCARGKKNKGKCVNKIWRE